LAPVVGSAIYRAIIEKPIAPDVKGRGVYQFDALPAQQPAALTQKVTQQQITSTPAQLAPVVGSAIYRAIIEKPVAPDVKGRGVYQFDALPQPQLAKGSANQEQTKAATGPQFNANQARVTLRQPSQQAQPQAQTHTYTESHTENHTWHVTINQLPGEDPKALVDKLMREMDKRKAQRTRGKLYDV
jgi:hypothetical protein